MRGHCDQCGRLLTAGICMYGCNKTTRPPCWIFTVPPTDGFPYRAVRVMGCDNSSPGSEWAIHWLTGPTLHTYLQHPDLAPGEDGCYVKQLDSALVEAARRLSNYEWHASGHADRRLVQRSGDVK